MYIICIYVILISVFSVGRPTVYILNNCNTHLCMHTCAHVFLLMFSHMQRYAGLCVFVCPSLCMCAHFDMCTHMHLCMHVCITINLLGPPIQKVLACSDPYFVGQDSLVQETSLDKHFRYHEFLQ